MAKEAELAPRSESSSDSRGLTAIRQTIAAAVTGANPRLRQTHHTLSCPLDAGLSRGKSCALTLGDGTRGVHDSIRFSIGFHSFIFVSFQTSSELLQAIAVTARDGVR